METNMRISQAATLAIGAAMLASFTGCIADTEQGDGEAEVVGLGEDGSTEVGTAEQAFSSIYAWGYGISGSYQADAMPYSTHTAFLMGVTGSLKTPSGASVGNVWDMNRLYMRSAPGKWIGAGVGAVGGTTGRTFMQRYENRADNDDTVNATELAPTTDPNLRCYITGVYSGGTEDPTHNAYNSQNDWVDIYSNQNKWYLGGHGRVGAWAACRKITERLGGKWIAWSASDATADLGFDEPGKHCFLTGIGGKIRNDSTDKGVRVYFDGGSQKWKLYVSAGNFGRAECNR
jgi:hypothetical protein